MGEDVEGTGAAKSEFRLGILSIFLHGLYTCGWGRGSVTLGAFWSVQQQQERHYLVKTLQHYLLPCAKTSLYMKLYREKIDCYVIQYGWNPYNCWACPNDPNLELYLSAKFCLLIDDQPEWLIVLAALWSSFHVVSLQYRAKNFWAGLTHLFASSLQSLDSLSTAADDLGPLLICPRCIVMAFRMLPTSREVAFLVSWAWLSSEPIQTNHPQDTGAYSGRSDFSQRTSCLQSDRLRLKSVQVPDSCTGIFLQSLHLVHSGRGPF